MRFLPSVVALAALAPAAYGQYPPPVVAAADPPPVVTRAEFEKLETRVKTLELEKLARDSGLPVAVLRDYAERGTYPTAAPQPAAKATAVCGCGTTKCPTTGFCGGAGCPCTQAKLHTVPTVAPPGVAIPADPFEFAPLSPCGPGGCPTATGIRVQSAGLTTGAPVPSWPSTPTGLTYTVTAGSTGVISGCANGSCASGTSARFAPFGGRFRR